MAGEFSTALRIVDVDTGFRLGRRDHDERRSFSRRRRHQGHDAGACRVRMHLAVAGEARPRDQTTIRDWAIHQGGLPVLMKFKDEAILGLTDEQLADSAGFVRGIRQSQLGQLLFYAAPAVRANLERDIARNDGRIRRGLLLRLCFCTKSPAFRQRLPRSALLESSPGGSRWPVEETPECGRRLRH